MRIEKMGESIHVGRLVVAQVVLLGNQSNGTNVFYIHHAIQIQNNYNCTIKEQFSGKLFNIVYLHIPRTDFNRPQDVK